MLAFPLLFLLSFLFFRSLVAALLPLMIGAAGDRRHLPDPERRERIRLDLDLRPQPDHRARPRAGDRLQPLHRLPLPRGDRQGRPRPGGDAPHDGDRRAHRPLLLADRRRRARLAARLPAALPLLDGTRRSAGRAAGGAGLADRAAGRARPCSAPGQLARAALPAAPGRGRRPARRAGLLVPALALRDAPAGADRDAQRALPDRARPALPRDQVHHRRPDRAAGGRRARGRSSRPSAPTSRPTARRRSGSSSRAATPRQAASCAARVRQTPGVAAVAAAAPAAMATSP